MRTFNLDANDILIKHYSIYLFFWIYLWWTQMDLYVVSRFCFIFIHTTLEQTLEVVTYESFVCACERKETR